MDATENARMESVSVSQITISLFHCKSPNVKNINLSLKYVWILIFYILQKLQLTRVLLAAMENEYGYGMD